MIYNCLLRKFFSVNGDGCHWITPPLQINLRLPFLPFAGLEIDAQKLVHPQKIVHVIWHDKSEAFHLDVETVKLSQNELASTLAYHKLEGWRMYDDDKSHMKAVRKIDYDLLKT